MNYRDDNKIIFWLIPGNEAAKTIVSDSANQHWVQVIEDTNCLRVGLDCVAKVPGRLITFGRDPARADILLRPRTFSKDHCHFFLNPESGVLLLRDTSACATQITVPEAELPSAQDTRIYQLQGAPRQRVVLPLNGTKLEISGV